MFSLEQVAERLKGLKKAAIVSHVAPDGDCVGSMVALGLGLQQQFGTEITFVNSDSIPEYLLFLAHTERVVRPAEVCTWPDTLICVDCSDLGRLGQEMRPFLADKEIINIDHHISNTQYGKVNYIDAEAAATGQIVFHLLKVLGIRLDKQIAAALYTALATDTGSFQYTNTTATTHRMAAELFETGLNIGEINRLLYDTKELAAVRLLGRALNSLELSKDGRLGWIAISQSVLAEFGAKDEHTEGIIGYIRSLKSVEAGMLFREVSPHKTKVSFRSKQYLDVNQLAATFGGGGHARAAGCVIDLGLEQAVNEVVNKAAEFLEAVNERNN